MGGQLNTERAKNNSEFQSFCPVSKRTGFQKVPPPPPSTHTPPHLGIVAALRLSQHLVEVLLSSQQARKAPEGAPSEAAAAYALVLAVPVHLDHAHAAANVDQQVRVLL